MGGLKAMSEKFLRITATPAEVEAIFGIPKGSLANMRWAKVGPKYFKAGSRRVLYRLADVKKWIESNPVLTKDDA
jgi:hypothetical protein